MKITEGHGFDNIRNMRYAAYLLCFCSYELPEIAEMLIIPNCLPQTLQNVASLNFFNIINENQEMFCLLRNFRSIAYHDKLRIIRYLTMAEVPGSSDDDNLDFCALVQLRQRFVSIADLQPRITRLF